MGSVTRKQREILKRISSLEKSRSTESDFRKNAFSVGNIRENGEDYTRVRRSLRLLADQGLVEVVADAWYRLTDEGRAIASRRVLKDSNGKAINRLSEYVLRHIESGEYIAVDGHPADANPRLTDDYWNKGQLFDGELLRELAGRECDWSVDYVAVPVDVEG